MDAQEFTMIFYIASGPPLRPFAPNPCKVRYALNFTKTLYRTTWVPLPDVAATRQKLGLPACRKHPDGSDYLTLPILYDPTTPATTSTSTPTQEDKGTYVGDSFDIAVHIHNKHSSSPNDDGVQHPTLFPPNTLALQRAFNAQVDALFNLNGAQLAGTYMPFDPSTADATRAEFARRAGVSWEDMQLLAGSEERAKKLAGFEAALGSGLAGFFNRRDEGPFLEGKTPMYADFIVGGWLRMMRVCLPDWEELRGWQGGLWGRLYDALEEWGEAL